MDKDKGSGVWQYGKYLIFYNILIKSADVDKGGGAGGKALYTQNADKSILFNLSLRGSRQGKLCLVGVSKSELSKYLVSQQSFINIIPKQF